MHETYPIVSVIVPTHNRSHIIRDTINTILAQTISDIEIIIVDDCSNDATEEVISKLKDKRLRYLRHDINRGAAAARNTGIKAAKGKYVAFLDSDDEWKPEKLERQLDVFASDANVDYVYSGWQWADRETRRVRKVRVPDKDGRIDGLPRWTYNLVQDLLIKTDVANSTMFDESLRSYEPLSILLRLASSYRSGHVSDILVINLEHGGARNSSTSRRVEFLHKMLEEHSAFIRTDRVAWAHLNYICGVQYLRYLGEASVARPFFWSTILASPCNWKAWLYAVASLVPGALLPPYPRVRISKSIRRDLPEA
jgi:glycosyltransferase involved in cell wall biosynthesis